MTHRPTAPAARACPSDQARRARLAAGVLANVCLFGQLRRQAAGVTP